MSVLSSLRVASEPSAAVELTSTHIAGIRLDSRRAPAAIGAHAIEPLPAGALVPSLTAGNIVDPAAVAAAFGRVMERIGRPLRIAVVLPDPAAKVSILAFEHVPARASDFEQLVRWQTRKTAPFPIEEAQISYVPGQTKAAGREFMVTIARRDVIAAYERLAVDAGAHPGLVDLASFNVINAALLAKGPAAPDEDWLLVHVAPGYDTLAVMRGREVVLFRSRLTDTESVLADLVHQTAMYYEDRLQGAGFARVVLANSAAAQDLDAARRELQARLTVAVDVLDLGATATLSDRIAGTSGVLATLAPLVGVLLRGQEAAA